MPTLPELQQWYAAHAAEVQSDFFKYLRFPSISTDPAHKPDILATAAWLKAYLDRIGMRAEIWETINHPVVFAYYESGPKAPTVLIYGHYDVQPVDPLGKWKSPPFEPRLEGKEVYARGSSDDKGQNFYSIVAIQAFLELAQQKNLNIKLFIEGEEESGSRGATDILPKKQKELSADHLLIVDAGLPSAGTPAITLGLRGIVTMEVVVRNSAIDLHSGIHGGLVLNPNRALIQLLSKLWDAEGKVAIPGFYKEVAEVTSQEMALIYQELDQESLRKTFGIRAFQGEGKYGLWDSNTVRPTLEINGIGGGYTGSGFKTVIPAEASAKISCRLVPHQDPDTIAQQVAQFLQERCPPGLELKIDIDHGGKPIRVSSSTRAAQVAKAAFEEVFGQTCKLMLCGASIPIVPDLAQACGGETALIGVALSSDDIHAPNEHFGMDRFEQGFLTIGRILAMMNSI
jgi:acetylornithine deacetylase/succinyl-diaminopimelate desuccinylase-like protein